jgi:predicted ATPase
MIRGEQRILVFKMDRFVVITGCSGGGKSTLLTALAQQGYCTVEEPGRRIVKEELSRQGDALPWVNSVAFARRALEVAVADYAAALRLEGIVFFDRCVIDAAVAIEHAIAEPILEIVARTHPYSRRVFVAPPWPEIYANDPERRHDFSQALYEFKSLLEAYKQLGYRLTVLPKVNVPQRMRFILSEVAQPIS